MPNKDEYMFHAKFGHAVSLNKRKLEIIIESLRNEEKPTPEYTEYLDKRDEILIKFAKKNDDGNPVDTIAYSDGQPKRAYVVPFISDKNSAVNKELNKLDEKYKDAIDWKKKKDEQMKKLMEDEADFRPHTVRWSMIPKGLSPDAMDGVVYMIEEDEDKEVDEKPTKPKK